MFQVVARCYCHIVRENFTHSPSDSYHMLCNTDIPDGCGCCKIRQPEICCELCHPTFFQELAPSMVTKPPAAPSRSRIKEYTAHCQDMELQDALHTFRKETGIMKFSLPYFTSHGASIVMSQRVLQRIVDCAHTGKIRTKDDLSRETRWGGTEEHSDIILNLISTHHPPPPSAAAPAPSTNTLVDINTNQTATPVSHSVRILAKRQCKACGSHEHICKSLLLRLN